MGDPLVPTGTRGFLAGCGHAGVWSRVDELTADREQVCGRVDDLHLCTAAAR